MKSQSKKNLSGSSKSGLLKNVEVGGGPLSLADIQLVAYGRAKVRLANSAKAKVQRAFQFLSSEVAKGKTLYGVNTGFGLLSNVRIEDKDLESLQYNLLRSHAVGIGEPMKDEVSAAMLLLRAHNLSSGYSGVRVELIEQILALLNARILPVIPAQGSVGASGDLAPLAHLALPLIGEGDVSFNGKIMPARAALKAAKIRPIRLGPKEGLALINGTQFMTAIGALTLLEAEHLCDVADYAGAMSLEALRGTFVAFDHEIHQVRPHPGQVMVAERLYEILTGGGLSEIARNHENCGKVQDPYSLRCMPQVHGPIRETLGFVRTVLEREANAVTDNPLVFPDSGKILSGGNFHGEIVAMAMDYLSIAVAELASISEQRIEKLINPALSDLPAFLTAKGGLNSGFMIIQVAAASIVSENKTLAHPASVDSIPTSADKEDHVSMGAWAARKAAQVVTNTRRVLSFELLSAAQGIDLLRPLRSTKRLELLHAAIRQGAKRLDADRLMQADMKFIETSLADFAWHPIVSKTK